MALVSNLRLVSLRQEIFSGPLPDPSTLKEYEELLPGSAERVIDMAERAIVHHQEMEAKQVENDAISNREAWSRSRLGAILGCIVALAFAGVSLGFVLAGHPTAGAVLGSLEVAALVGAFMYGTRRQQLLQPPLTN
jgi:uncharacterized membrane protein